MVRGKVMKRMAKVKRIGDGQKGEMDPGIYLACWHRCGQVRGLRIKKG